MKRDMLDEQALFDERGRRARATILYMLHGCQSDDANKVCGMATAKAMWDTLIGDKTQRDDSMRCWSDSSCTLLHMRKETVDGRLSIDDDYISAAATELGSRQRDRGRRDDTSVAHGGCADTSRLIGAV